MVQYPRISPAIITAVIKDDTILLGCGVNYPNKKMFRVLAGFVEPGENLEACVQNHTAATVSTGDVLQWKYEWSMALTITKQGTRPARQPLQDPFRKRMPSFFIL